MKRILLLCSVLLTLNAFAQKFSFGIEGGLNSSTFFNQTNGRTYVGLGYTNSFQLGAITECKFGAGFFGQSGLFFSRKGSDVFATDENTGSFTTIKMSYLQIPFNLEYKIPLTKDLKAIIGTGLYFSVGLSGTEKGIDNSTGTIVPVDRPIHYTTDNEYNVGYTSANPFDVGYNLFGGVEYKSFQFKFNFNKGFSKVLTASDNKFVNDVINISAGYLIKLK